MDTSIKMYKSLRNICLLFDVSRGYIRNNIESSLVEGKHYIYIGNMKRYNVDEMKKLLMREDTKSTHNNIMDKFLI